LIRRDIVAGRLVKVVFWPVDERERRKRRNASGAFWRRR